MSPRKWFPDTGVIDFGYQNATLNWFAARWNYARLPRAISWFSSATNYRIFTFLCFCVIFGSARVLEL